MKHNRLMVFVKYSLFTSIDRIIQSRRLNTLYAQNTSLLTLKRVAQACIHLPLYFYAK
jgi:hypothetical protein